MQLPPALAAQTELIAAKYKTPVLIQAAQSMSEAYRMQKAGSSALPDDAAVAAYCVTRMPATYAAVFGALSHAFECFDGEIKTVCDAGAGTGAASWAVCELLSPEKITCLELDMLMSDTGKALTANAPNALANAQWIKCDLASCKTPEKADLVICSYVLCEMKPHIRDAVLDKLWNATGKMLLIAEPGTPAAFEAMLGIRDAVKNRGGFIAAPCPHDDNCPSKKPDWCHFTARIERTRLHRLLKSGDAPFEDEKYTYFAFTKEPAKQCISRILRHPAIHSRYVGLSLCTAQGIQNQTISKKEGLRYKAVRKASCGDAFD